MKCKKTFKCATILASIAFMVGCSASSIRSTGSRFDQTTISGNFAADEVEVTEVDLTGDTEISTEGAATKEEILELAYSLYSKPVVDYYISQAQTLADYIFDHNCFSLREIEVIIKALLTELPNLTQSGSKQTDAIVRLVIDLVSKVDIDKLIDTIRGIIENEPALNEAKNVMYLAMTHATGLYKGAALAYPEDEELQELARLEAITRPNIKIINADGLTMFNVVPELVQKKECVVLLRVVSYLFKTLSTYLDEYSYGYILSSLFGVGDDAYKEMCTKYTLEHLADYMVQMGTAIAHLDFTVETWAAFLDGFKSIVFLSNQNGIQLDNLYAARENKIIDQYLNQLDSVFENVKPSGFKVMIRFIGDFIAHVDQDLIDEVQEYSTHMADFDPSAVIDIYNEVYGLLTEDEKNDLDTQFALFGIDIHNLNTAIDELDPRSRSSLGPIMDLININITVPILQWFSENLEAENPYEYNISVSRSSDTRHQLIFREGDVITEEDLLSYITADSSFQIQLEGRPPEAESYTTYSDTPSNRKNIVFSQSTVDTSAAGNSGNIIFTLTASFEYTKEGGESAVFEYEGIEIRWYYEVLPAEVDFYTIGFLSMLLQNGNETYDAKDSNGAQARVNKQSLNREIMLVQDADYADDELVIATVCAGAYIYDSETKRFELGWGEVESVNLSELKRDELGEFWYVADYDLKDMSGETVLTTKMVFNYTVVKGINDTDFGGSYYDPGFIYGGN